MTSKTKPLDRPEDRPDPSPGPSRVACFISLLAGAIYPLGFAPFSLWPLALISVAILFYLVTTHSRTILISFLYGIGVFAVGVSWVYVSMVNFGNMPPALAAVAVALFVLALASFFMLVGLLAGKKRGFFSLVLRLPALWVISEALRGWVLTGLPWLLLGYASIDSPMAAWAPLAGVMGNSLIMAMIAGALVYAILHRQTAWKGLLMITVLIGVGFGLGKLEWSEPSGRSSSLALIQRNISLADKWQPGKAALIREAYLSESQKHADVDLIVWPEAAIPQLFDQVPADYVARLNELPASIALGGVERRQADGQRELYNSLFVLGAEETTQVYRKRHLVPYGEYFPLQWLLGWLMNQLQIPMSDFSSWRAPQAPLLVNEMRVAPTICYEDAFPEEWRRIAGESEVLLNISEDAWFGDSLAPHQRLEMARFRALEMARPMVRVSNSGLSAIIDEQGNVRSISPQFQAYALRGTVEGKMGLTPYVRWGRWPLYTILLLILSISILLHRGAHFSTKGKTKW